MPDEDPDVSIKTIPQAFQRRIRTGVYHGQQNGKRLKLCKQGHCAGKICHKQSMCLTAYQINKCC